MVSRAVLSIGVASLLLVVTSGNSSRNVVAAQTETQTERTQSARPPSKKHDGFEITFISIERMKEARIRGMLATPKKGYELAVVRIEVGPSAGSSKRELKLAASEMDVVDSTGAAHEADVALSFSFGTPGTPPSKLPRELVFAVPDGAKLTKLHVGRAEFLLK